MAEDERHPVTGDITRDMLVERVAQLWDQVWWLSLPQEQRDHWVVQGFEAPVQRFYGEVRVGRRRGGATT